MIDDHFGRRGHLESRRNAERDIGERRIEVRQFVRVLRDVAEGGETYLPAPVFVVEAHLGIAVGLPAEVGVVGHRVGNRVVQVGGAVAVREAEGLDVPVLLPGEQDVEARQLVSDAPAPADGQLRRDVPPDIQPRGQRLQVLVLRPFDEGAFSPEAGADLQPLPGKLLLGIDGQVVHVRIVRIGPRPVSVRRQGGVFVVLAPADVSIGLPLDAGLEDALHGPEMVQPVIFERGGVIEFPGVGNAVGIEGEGQGGRQEIPRFLRMDGGLGRAEGVVQVFVCPVVVVIDGPFQAQVRDPGAVNHPDQFRMGGQEVVPGLGEFIRESVGVVLAVHPAHIAGNSRLQPQHAGEGPGILRRESAAGVRRVGRGQFLRRPGPFSADVQHPAAQADALGHGGIVRAWIDGKDHLHGGAAFFRRHAHHPAPQVAVFGRGDAGNDLHGLDVLHLEPPCVHPGETAEGGVVAHADSVDLHRRAEGRVAGGGSAAAHRQFRGGRQVRIHGLAARHQGGDVGKARRLEVVQGRPFDLAGGVEVFLGLFGRHDDLVQGQRLLLQDNRKSLQGPIHLQGPHVGRIAQALRLHPVGAGLHGVEGEPPFPVGHGPEIVPVQAHDRTGHRVSGRPRHASPHPVSGGEGGNSQKEGKEYGQQPFHPTTKIGYFPACCNPQ